MIKSGSLWVKVIAGLMLGLISLIAVGGEADAIAQELSNQAPIPNAGADFSVDSSQTSFQLNGSVNDPDHLLVRTLWIQVYGPARTIFSDAYSLTPTITHFLPGHYVFRLLVLDTNSRIGFDDVLVTIN